MLIVTLHDDYSEIDSLTSQRKTCFVAVTIEEIASELDILDLLSCIHYNYKHDKDIDCPFIWTFGYIPLNIDIDVFINIGKIFISIYHPIYMYKYVCRHLRPDNTH